MKELFITLSNVLNLHKEKRLVYQEQGKPEPMSPEQIKAAAELADKQGLKVPDFMKTKAEGKVTAKKAEIKPLVSTKDIPEPRTAAYNSNDRSSVELLSPSDEIKQNVDKLDSPIRETGIKNPTEINNVKAEIRRIANNMRAESGNPNQNPAEVKKFLTDVNDLIKQLNGRNVNVVALQSQIRKVGRKISSKSA